jgi:site-specific DNA-cytosine methylase
MHIDIGELTADMILERFGKPDVIWAGFDCTTFSIAAISHHRTKNPVTGSLEPKSDYAKKCDEVNKHCLDLIKQLAPKFYFIENPVAGLRKMDYMQPIPRHTITYCQYGFHYRKATDIFTNHPDPQFKPPCHNGDPCHEKAPRGSKTGLQGIKDKALRSAYPPALCEHIVDICEKGMEL